MFWADQGFCFVYKTYQVAPYFRALNLLKKITNRFLITQKTPNYVKKYLTCAKSGVTATVSRSKVEFVKGGGGVVGRYGIP